MARHLVVHAAAQFILMFGCAGQIASPRLISLSTRVTAQEGIAQFQMFASTTSPRAGTTDDPGLKGVAD